MVVGENQLCPLSSTHVHILQEIDKEMNKQEKMLQ